MLHISKVSGDLRFARRRHTHNAIPGATELSAPCSRLSALSVSALAQRARQKFYSPPGYPGFYLHENVGLVPPPCHQVSLQRSGKIRENAFSEMCLQGSRNGPNIAWGVAKSEHVLAIATFWALCAIFHPSNAFSCFLDAFRTASRSSFQGCHEFYTKRYLFCLKRMLQIECETRSLQMTPKSLNKRQVL